MRLEALDNRKLGQFIQYCKKHKKEIDDSFLYDEDLEAFEPNDENPTYIAIDQQEKIVATASLIIDEYSRRGKKARFRIFHSEIEDMTVYSLLLKSIIEHTTGLEKVFIFVPVINTALIRSISGLNFSAERYSFLFLKEITRVPDDNLPEGYEIRIFQPEKDEQVWCDIRNAGFAGLIGSETPIIPEMVKKLVSDQDYIEGGLMLLYHGDTPVGIVRGAADEYENSPAMNIGPLALMPQYQGKGLGRSLLRAALRFAGTHSYSRAVLCVNGENERAKALYLQEGFEQVEAVVCYKYDIGD